MNRELEELGNDQQTAKQTKDQMNQTKNKK